MDRMQDDDLGNGSGGREAQFSLPSSPRYSTDESTSPPASSAALLDLVINNNATYLTFSRILIDIEVDLATSNYHHLPSPKVENSAAVRGPSHKLYKIFRQKAGPEVDRSKSLTIQNIKAGLEKVSPWLLHIRQSYPASVEQQLHGSEMPRYNCSPI